MQPCYLLKGGHCLGLISGLELRALSVGFLFPMDLVSRDHGVCFVCHPLPRFKLRTATMARYQKFDALDSLAMAPLHSVEFWSHNFLMLVNSYLLVYTILLPL